MDTNFIITGFLLMAILVWLSWLMAAVWIMRPVPALILPVQREASRPGSILTRSRIWKTWTRLRSLKDRVHLYTVMTLRAVSLISLPEKVAGMHRGVLILPQGHGRNIIMRSIIPAPPVMTVPGTTLFPRIVICRGIRSIMTLSVMRTGAWKDPAGKKTVSMYGLIKISVIPEI